MPGTKHDADVKEDNLEIEYEKRAKLFRDKKKIEIMKIRRNERDNVDCS